jgi:hypothetical protein
MRPLRPIHGGLSEVVVSAIVTVPSGSKLARRKIFVGDDWDAGRSRVRRAAGRASAGSAAASGSPRCGMTPALLCDGEPAPPLEEVGAEQR